MKMTKYILFFLIVCVTQISEASSSRSNSLLTTQYNQISNVISKRCHVSLTKLPVSNIELELEVEIDDNSNDNEIEYKQIVFCERYSLTYLQEKALNALKDQTSFITFFHNLRKYGLFILLGQLLI